MESEAQIIQSSRRDADAYNSDVRHFFDDFGGGGATEEETVNTTPLHTEVDVSEQGNSILRYGSHETFSDRVDRSSGIMGPSAYSGHGSSAPPDSVRGVDVLEELLESLGASTRTRSNLEMEERPVGEENAILDQQQITDYVQSPECQQQMLFGITDSQQTAKKTVQDANHQQSVMLMQGTSGQLEPVARSGAGSRQTELEAITSSAQQIVIPIDVNKPQQLQTGNTVLLPIIPTLMPDGKIEIRVAGNAIPLCSTFPQQQELVTPTDSENVAQFPRELLQTKLNFADALGPQTKIVVIGSEESPVELAEQQHHEQIADNSSMERIEEIVGTPAVAKRQKTPASAGKMFSCDLCDYSNSRRYLLQRHLRSHSEHRPHVCQVCERKFKTPSSLNNHINTHSGTKPFPCKECDMAFTTSGELVRHVRYKHSLEKPHKCQECDYATVELSKLKRHMRSHTGERPFKCQFCEYTSPDTYKLKRHVRVHTGEKPYECQICLSRFTQSNSLKTHKLTHTPDEKPVFKCQYCPTTCGRKTDLRIHVQKLHESAHPVRCVKCGKSFPDRYSFKIHYRSHDGQKCFACPHCSYAAFSQRHLEQHILVHSETKAFQCSENNCGKKFRQVSQLRRHQNLTHNPHYKRRPVDKAHACTQCGKRFRHFGNLRRHERMHADGEYIFPDTEEEEEELSVENPLIVAEKPDEYRNSSGEADSKSLIGRMFFAKPSIITSIKQAEMVKRRAAQKLLKKRRMQKWKPEELGLTNLKRRGRPRKVGSWQKWGLHSWSGVEEARLETPESTKSSELQKELSRSFGFSELTDPSINSNEQESAESNGLIDEELPESETLMITDSSGFPIPDAGGRLDNRSLEQSISRVPAVFDLEAEECAELVAIS